MKIGDSTRWQETSTVFAGSLALTGYPCWTCHRDGINAILREVDKYFLQMKNHRKSRLCARSAVREMTSESSR
ncbi:unnamed protein product [Dicrocoelium dendriticum]|nr:unnamed protein product [Dicrocoelium dendriticum]